MVKTVLLTVDLNHPPSCTKALPQAVELVRTSGDIPHIMSEVPNMGISLTEKLFPEDFEERAVATANEAPKDIAIKQHLAVGSIHRKVLKNIAKTDYDLVNLALHKPDRVREFLGGSNADRVIPRSPVSVLVVRA